MAPETNKRTSGHCDNQLTKPTIEATETLIVFLRRLMRLVRQCDSVPLCAVVCQTIYDRWISDGLEWDG